MDILAPSASAAQTQSPCASPQRDATKSNVTISLEGRSHVITVEKLNQSFSDLQKSIQDFNQLPALLRAVRDAANSGRFADVELLVDAGMLVAESSANYADCLVEELSALICKGQQH